MNGIPASPSPRLIRFARFPPLRLLLLGGVLYLLIGFSNGLREDLAASPLLSLIAALAMSALGLAVYWCFVRLVERRPVSELGLPRMGREVLAGIALGAALYGGTVLILMLLGCYRIEGLNPWPVLLPPLAMALSSGVIEELLFRGALFRILEEWLGSWISLAISCLVFGLIHLGNDGATLFGAISISIEAGVLLAAAYMLTRRLWMCMGLHMAWNYTQSAIFSGTVSGGYSTAGLIRPVVTGPELLTGGAFGLEASLIAIVLCTAAGVLLLVLAVKRGHVVPPPWRR